PGRRPTRSRPCAPPPACKALRTATKKPRLGGAFSCPGLGLSLVTPSKDARHAPLSHRPAASAAYPPRAGHGLPRVALRTRPAGTGGTRRADRRMGRRLPPPGPLADQRRTLRPV